MKRYENKTVTKEESQFLGVTCDLCGKENDNDAWPVDDGKGNSIDDRGTDVEAYMVRRLFRVNVKTQETTYIYETGDSKTWSVDLCPECFRGRLLVWLVEQGAKINIEEYDW